jgi:hypothetical protein
VSHSVRRPANLGVVTIALSLNKSSNSIYVEIFFINKVVFEVTRKGEMFMKATASRTLFGVLLSLVGGPGFGFLTWIVVQHILRSNYNSYYAESGAGLPGLGVFFVGLLIGILLPFINKRRLRPAIGAGGWTLGTVIFLFLPFVFKNLFIPWSEIGACSLISILGGTVLGWIAAWVDLP